MHPATAAAVVPTNAQPVVVVGAGPVGLAAAANLAERGELFLVLERGVSVGAAVRAWGHVGMFSPWRYNVDKAARRLLETADWRSPDQEALPTGHDLVDQYLVPLARHAAIAPFLRFNAEVTAIGRKDFDKVRTKGRDVQPFELHLASGEVIEARAVIDASGTWGRPNPAGSNGLYAVGERESADHVSYGIPDVLRAARARFAGKRVMVVGSGHSAINVLLDLQSLAREAAGTEIVWVMRRENLDTVWGGGAGDALEARGLLGERARLAVEAGMLKVLSPFRVRAIRRVNGSLEVAGTQNSELSSVAVDEVIVATGFRPNLDMLNEIRVQVDPWLECTAALGPLIDPNLHSCGTVRPHGARELAHPEPGFFVVGMKSYGRAPTFLLATGYEQARSVTAFLAGDLAAADRVELELPETGVCSTDNSLAQSSCCGKAPSVAVVGVEATTGGCCGGPAPVGVDACCVQDADAKAAEDEGCGCATSAPPLLQIAR